VNRAALLAALRQRPADDRLAHDVARLIAGEPAKATRKLDRCAAAVVAGFVVQLQPEADIAAEARTTEQGNGPLWAAASLLVALLDDLAEDEAKAA
jgi:hypothetical protein